MIKVRPPLYSLAAHGWLGGDMYGHRDYQKGVWHEPKGLVTMPYPVAFFPRYLMTSPYYSRIGWVYQRRRTWHGIIYSAMRPPISANRKTPYQIAQQTRFGDAVRLWQTMSAATKNIYHHWKYPVHASGYNRFLRWYILHTSAPVVITFHILQEDSGLILTESLDILTQET